MQQLVIGQLVTGFYPLNMQLYLRDILPNIKCFIYTICTDTAHLKIGYSDTKGAMF